LFGTSATTSRTSRTGSATFPDKVRNASIDGADVSDGVHDVSVAIITLSEGVGTSRYVADVSGEVIDASGAVRNVFVEVSHPPSWSGASHAMALSCNPAPGSPP
jgi:hypothetical protein